MSERKRGRPRLWKDCPECGKRRRIAEDFYHWPDSRNGHERSTRVCKACTRRRARERYARVTADTYLAKHEREMNAARQRRYRKEKPSKNADRCRRYRERIKAQDPARHQQILEDARIRSRLARTNGDTMPVSVVRPFKEPPGHLLPAAPLHRFIATIEGPLFTHEALDFERTISRTLDQTSVSVSVADRIVTVLGGTLANVYPELYA